MLVAPRTLSRDLQCMRALRPAVVLLVVAAGCAPSLSSFQPAHVPARGHVQAEAGMDISIPTGTISRIIDSGETLARSAESRTLTSEERGRLVEAGANLA